ncbi:hypothetical protein R3W88_007981 [Solanum pinnatisectum]|uniref:Leucine-rich repeat domain, L domain-containing protein n=1 Tax=Solanum pinnatisectum TaxID=50273 RepID=A0AAV9M6M5_9SOLN|nr:hypothetical protein R3W88_007981 [Solanum pinnatisectum]
MPPKICRLWNLQTFIVEGYMHLKLAKIIFPNPLSVSIDDAYSNIQTIYYLSPSCCTKEVILGIQNVKKLGIKGCYRNYGFLDNLYQLETLSLKGACPSTKALPGTLKKLKLKETYRSWSYLDIIAESPNLEVLKLMYKACSGNEWYPIIMGFTRFKFC